MSAQAQQHTAGRRLAVIVACLALLLVSAPAARAQPAATGPAQLAATGPAAVIVRGAGAEAAVVKAGGTVTARFGALGAVAATVPATALPAIADSDGVETITPDGTLTLSSTEESGAYDGSGDHTSLWWLGELTGAHDLWRDGLTGNGVDVAMIDSGIVPVRGLADESRVLHGPDVSLEAVHDDLRHLDTFGHGTHLGGIIAARDPAGIDPDDPTLVQGLAPGARLISIKAAEQRGVADVSQIMAAIDWVIANADDHGLNIRVLLLAFATDSAQSYLLDPLSHAVEQAWRSGILVVVAAGNGGNQSPGLPIPAANPLVVAVGASDTGDNADPGDDEVADFSSRGSVSRTPDVLAPGTQIISLRSPGSYLDQTYPEARIGETMFRGSGTSQAAAVVSGLAALLIQQHPGYSPDQILHLLTTTADAIPGTSSRLQGSGVVDARGASDHRRLGLPLLYRQLTVPSTGLGSLDGSRAGLQVVDNGVALTGQVDIFGKTLDAASWAGLSGLGLAFSSGGEWNGNRWAGNGFEGNRWAAGDWTGNRWAGNRWAAEEWTGNRWAGNRWAGEGWTGNRWATGDWSSSAWATAAWE